MMESMSLTELVEEYRDCAEWMNTVGEAETPRYFSTADYMGEIADEYYFRTRINIRVYVA